jgi:hypothetical protein
MYGGENDGRFEITLSDLLKENIFVEKWELLTQANNSLIGVGITVEKEINLQPIVNLLELKWQTHASQEDLYKDGVNVSNYLGYNRDEVYPFAIRFLLKGGYKTALFPLINRNAKDSDLEIVPTNNLDRKSIESDKTKCVTSLRNKYWQYYNTATVDNDFCLGQNTEYVEVDEEVLKVCVVENVFTIPASTYTLDIDENFTDLKTYIETNKENCITVPAGSCPNLPTPITFKNTYGFCNYLDLSCYTNFNCIPTFNDQRVSKIVIGSEYVIYNINSGDNFIGTGFVATGLVFTAVGQPTIWTNNTDVFKNSCTTPVKASPDEIVIANVINEKIVKIESTFPSEYESTLIKSTCRIYKQGEYHGVEVDQRANRFVVPPLDANYFSLMPCGQTLLVRDTQGSTYTSKNPANIQNIIAGGGSSYIQSYFNDYDITTTLSDLIDVRPAIPATDWSATLHKKAIWFKNSTIKNRFIFEVTPQKLTTQPDAETQEYIPNGTTVRLSLYKSNKGSDSPFYSIIVDLSVGAKFLFQKTPTGFSITPESGIPFLTTEIATSKFYVAIDCKIVTQNTSSITTTRLPGRDDHVHCEDEPGRVSYRIAPTNGCFSVVTRDIEYSRAEVSFTSIQLDKKQTYTSICTFQKPILSSCKATPNKKGTFAYWQSDEKYPDNSALYNSSVLKVKPSDIPLKSRLAFENNFVIQIGVLIKTPVLDASGNYQWRLDQFGKPLSNYTCRQIQHFKMPDNKISPFMYESQQLSQSNSIIYPLGATIDETTVNAYLDLAVKSNLITQEKRNLISGYEIFRGEINQDRSIQSSGFLFNMRTYEQDGQVFQYSNYPYNDLGVDKLNLDSKSISYNKFTYHSPETDYYRPTLASELSIQGYQFGQTTNNYFDEVENHPKYVILTDSARRVARNLALLEVATEIAVTAASSAEVYKFEVGTSTGGNPAGIVLNVLASALSAVSTIIVNYGRYRLQWLKTFRDLGEPQNFAYYNHSSAKYNYLQTIQLPQQQLRAIHQARYLKPKNTILVDDVTGLKLNINNLDREKSVFISLGESNSITYPTQYSNFDNNISDNNTGSLGFAREVNACAQGRSKILNKNVASPYVALKNYLPNQHGTINSINWLSTGYRGDLILPLESCTPIFGGDTFITRHTAKRKLALFKTDNFKGTDLLPFAYKQHCNIGRNPRFYIDYEVGGEFDTGQGNIIPDITYELALDCETKDGNYYKPPSKFYLYYYGVPSFLTETRINTWNRTAEKELKNNFYPNTGDTGELTQQKNVEIGEEEKFFYNQVYSKQVTSIAKRTLKNNFNQIESDCKDDAPNGLLWSNTDGDENGYNDPYLIYNSLNRFEVPSKYGKIKDVRTIEREQILIRQEHATSLFNALDLSVDDGTTPETRNLATAFARRPMTYTETDLGYGGTQSTQSVSCEFGHFHVDAKRGQVIQVKTGGQGMEDIASTINGQPSGMRNWFKQHLPFKILKSKITNVENIDLDNGINGLGIIMGYDARFRRIFITKKDYILKPLLAGQSVAFENFKFYLVVGAVKTEIKITNTTYFEDVSFTIAYSPLEQKFIGWYSYCPNYYIAHQNYFQTGINNSTDANEFGLWSHLLTNRSYGVFYGKKNPFIVEYMLKRTYGNMLLKSVGFDMDVVRYHSEYDMAQIDNKTFNKAWISSPYTHSGQLNLVPNTGVLSLISQYPKTLADNTEQDILITKVGSEFNFNYFYNRLLSHSANQPSWLFDKNSINKVVNKEIVKFSGKTVLEPLRSSTFSVRLQADNDSRLKYSINLLASKTNLEN